MVVHHLEQHIAIYQAMRNVCPIHIGGSFALLLHGYDLKRPVHDLDIIIPEGMNEFNYTPINKAIRELNPDSNYESSSSMNNFDLGYRTFTETGNQVNVDVKYASSKPLFTDIIYKEQSFRVTTLEYIIEAKMRYAIGGTRLRHKHEKDLRILHEQGCPGINIAALPVSFGEAMADESRTTRRSRRGGSGYADATNSIFESLSDTSSSPSYW